MINREWTTALDAPREKAGDARRSLLLTSCGQSNNETSRATDHLADAIELASIVLLAVVGNEHDGTSTVKEDNSMEKDI